MSAYYKVDGFSHDTNRADGNCDGSSNKNVDMPGASTTSGTQFIQYSPNTGDNQKYMLTLIP